MKTNYTIISEKEHSARAMALDLPISTKQSIEICSAIRSKPLEKAKEILKRVIKLKTPIPFKRFKLNVGHKRGHLAAGRYPIKASEYILKLLNQVETNAQDKGLNTDNLVIKHIKADYGSRIWHRGRQSRQKMKRTHIEVVTEEMEKETKPKGDKQK